MDKLFNPNQPNRPSIAPDGTKLAYRTHVSRRNARFKIFNRDIMMAQLLLYRWARREFVSGCSIANIHSYIFHNEPGVTKRDVGLVLVQATIYDPRVMRSKTVNREKSMKIYLWEHPLDLIYGLEWMLCMWIWRFEDESARTPEGVARILEEIATHNDEEFAINFGRTLDDHEVSGKREGKQRLDDWVAFWARHRLTLEIPGLEDRQVLSRLVPA